jgi:hypothetical protein
VSRWRRAPLLFASMGPGRVEVALPQDLNTRLRSCDRREFSGVAQALGWRQEPLRHSTWVDVQSGWCKTGRSTAERHCRNGSTVGGNLYPEGTVQLPLPLAPPGVGSCWRGSGVRAVGTKTGLVVQIEREVRDKVLVGRVEAGPVDRRSRPMAPEAPVASGRSRSCRSAETQCGRPRVGSVRPNASTRTG